jgi:selenide,water dikinase
MTKSLGTGLITTAAKNGRTDNETLRSASEMMKQLNKQAADAISAVCTVERKYNCAVTDITGYGLLGHLLEMLTASDKSAVINFSNVPLLPGVIELAKLDLFPGGSRSNLQSAEGGIIWDGEFEQYEKLILSDAQTSGGLLDLAGELETVMTENSVDFARIGEVSERQKWLARVTKN